MSFTCSSSLELQKAFLKASVPEADAPFDVAIFRWQLEFAGKYNVKDIISDDHGKAVHHLVLAQEVSFFNKASLLSTLDGIPANSKVIIDCTNSKSIAYDVIEIINDYELNAKTKNIVLEKINFKP